MKVVRILYIVRAGVETTMEGTTVEREYSALGNLFQQIITDMKVRPGLARVCMCTRRMLAHRRGRFSARVIVVLSVIFLKREFGRISKSNGSKFMCESKMALNFRAKNAPESSFCYRYYVIVDYR